jgi:hypothetical protein
VQTKKSIVLTTALVLVLSLCLPRVAFAGTYSDGNGTEGNPYQIADLDDLQELQNTSAGWGAYFI